MSIILLSLIISVLAVAVTIIAVEFYSFYHSVKEVTEEIHKKYTDVQEKIESLESRCGK